MSDSDSARAFEAQAAARDKFDYYVTGLGAAIFTYSLNELQALRIGWNAYSTILLGLVCILFSLYWGIKRIESVVLLKRLNFELLHANERAGVFARALEEYQPGQELINYATGLTATRDTARAEYTKARAEADNAKKWLEDALKPGEKYSSRRNFWLGLGVFLLLAGRVWEGYSPPSSESHKMEPAAQQGPPVNSAAGLVYRAGSARTVRAKRTDLVPPHTFSFVRIDFTRQDGRYYGRSSQQPLVSGPTNSECRVAHGMRCHLAAALLR